MIGSSTLNETVCWIYFYRWWLIKESSIDIAYIVSQQTTNKDIHIQFEPDSVHIRIEKPISIDQTVYILIINLYCLFSLCSWRFHQLSTNMSHYGHYVLIDVVSRCNNSLENDLLIIHCVKQRNSQQPSDYLLQTSTSSKQWKQYKSTEDHTKVYFFAQEQKLTRSAKVNISQNTTLEHPLVFCKFSLLLNINNK